MSKILWCYAAEDLRKTYGDIILNPLLLHGLVSETPSRHSVHGDVQLKQIMNTLQARNNLLIILRVVIILVILLPKRKSNTRPQRNLLLFLIVFLQKNNLNMFSEMDHFTWIYFTHA